MNEASGTSIYGFVAGALMHAPLLEERIAKWQTPRPPLAMQRKLL